MNAAILDATGRESGVRYRGLAREADRRGMSIAPGEWILFEAHAGDLVALRDVEGGAHLLLTALGETERKPSVRSFEGEAARTVRLPASAHIPERLLTLCRSRDGSIADARAIEPFDGDGDAAELHCARLTASALVIAYMPVVPGWLEGGGGGRVEIEHRASPDRNDALLPEPIGRIVDEFRVDRATARAYEVRAGQFVQVIDVRGRQCSDFMAMRADALHAGVERFIDGTVTRTMTRGAYPRPGLHDKFFDQDMAPLLALRQDTVGRHDTFALACTARGYEERGFPGHVNCSDNISAAYAPFGIAERRAWPAVNFFFNSWIDGGGRGGTQAMGADEAWSRAGDYVAMEAITDLVCVSTACPDDVDPINGWDPTDIHVRIYDRDAPILRAVTHRWHPDEPGTMTRASPFHPRTSRLTSSFHVAQDVWQPIQYDATGAIGEYWACRERATVQDLSSLRKFDIAGPDAETLLQQAMTRDVSRLAIHRGLYALICDEAGQVVDDGTLFRLEPQVFRWCCGSEGSGDWLRKRAEERNLRVHIRSLHARLANLAVQGPHSRDILREIVFTQPTRPGLDNLKWFGFTQARLHDRDGAPFMLTRTGFTGELGYEIFCDAGDAISIWDAVTEAGEPHGLVPMGTEALAMLRVEAGLMAAGAEFAPEVDAMEAGLGFAVDLRKETFVGREALARNAEAPRRRLVGLSFASDDVPDHGDTVFAGDRPAGVVTSAVKSPLLGRGIAMARMAVEHAEEGGALEVGRLDGCMKRLACTVVPVPFLDPKREKPRA